MLRINLDEETFDIIIQVAGMLGCLSTTVSVEAKGRGLPQNVSSLSSTNIIVIIVNPRVIIR